MSMAGGYHKAVERAAAVQCDCVQIFTAPPRQFSISQGGARSGAALAKHDNLWRAKLIAPAEAEQFRTALREQGIKHPLAHDGYLINLASPDAPLWKKSIDAFVEELLRAELLGIPYVVAHPGAYTTSSEERGLKRIAEGLDEVHRQTKGIAAQCLLETTAGQGSNLGWRFEHLAEIISLAKHPDRLGICFDTCHVFAAGYALATKKDYLATMRALDDTAGLEKVKAFHVNDSKAKFGSRVDRHAHIGQGVMTLEPFRFLMNDRRFRRVPMYMETPKGTEQNVDCDILNLRTLRGLIAG